MPIHRLRIIVIIVTIVGLATIAQVTRGQESITVEGLAEQLSRTQEQLRDAHVQLQRTQQELDRLQERDAERREWEREIMRQLPPVDDSVWRTASHGRHSSRHAGCDDCCPDCGKKVCPGVPHLCGFCLDKLSWNKSGGWRVVPSGLLRGEMIYSEAEQSADAVIFFLTPKNIGVDDDQFTVHGKTSMLNFAITGPNIGSWQTGGAIITNFLGPQPTRNTSGLNIVNAYGELRNDRWRFAFGRQMDLFSPIGPTAVNMGAHRAAGNVGIFRGAFHFDRYFDVNEDMRWTLSGRLSQNTVNDYLLLPTSRGVDNGFPNFEGRLGVELGPERNGVRPIEIGISGLWGETRSFDPARIDDSTPGFPIILPPVNVVSTTAGGNIDFQFRGERFGLRGELWKGQAAGTYFVAVLQSLNPVTGRGIRSIGGWGEVYYKLNECVTFHLGYGIDDPRNQDVGFITPGPNDPGQRLLNQVVWGNLMYDVTSFYQLGLEVSHRETHYLNPANSTQGMLFHVSSTLKY